MKFTVNFGTVVPSTQELADVAISGLPAPVQIKFAEPRGFHTQEIELPHDRAFTLTINVFFRRFQEQVDVIAEVKNVAGVDIHQFSDHYVLVDVRHQVGRIEAQCTVSCPTTGESRSGRNVCIECKTARGTVKICC